jgi:dermatan 4-sulfotransferase 1
VNWSPDSLADIALPNISQVHVSDIAAVTQSSDLEKRSEWQRDQVNKFCQKYGLKRQLYVLPRDNKERYVLYRHLIYDSRKKFIFCFLPKVGCTTLRRLIFVMQGAIPLQSVNWTHMSEAEYLRPAIQRTSFLNTQLTDKMRLQKLKKYFKFMMIRNPLERLVSVYRNKIEPPLELCNHDKRLDPLVVDVNRVPGMDYFQACRRLILTKYSPCQLIEWACSNGNYSLSVDFTTYVKWIIDTEDRDLNEHFSSILFNAAPCRVGYHLYLNFKNYSRDVRLLIEKLNTSSEYFIDHNSHGTVQDEMHSKLPYYYSQLSDEMKRKLFVCMYTELDFLLPPVPRGEMESCGSARHQQVV